MLSLAHFLSFQDAVAKLYDLRDHYFETHSIEEASDKTTCVEAWLTDTLSNLDSLQGQFHLVKTT